MGVGGGLAFSLDSLICNCNLQGAAAISFCVKQRHKCICLGSVSSAATHSGRQTAISRTNNIPSSEGRTRLFKCMRCNLKRVPPPPTAIPKRSPAPSDPALPSAATGFIDFTPITHANHVRTRKQNARFRILPAAAARAQTAAERLTIFTLINSVNTACRGRIYTHDYIALIKKRGKKSRGSRWRRRGGNRQPAGDAHRH